MKSRSFENLAHKRTGPFAEKRIYMKSGESSRYVRISPRDQILAWGGGILLVGWAVAATAVAVSHYIGVDDVAAQVSPEVEVFETRVTELASERDHRLVEARAAQEQFSVLLSQLSDLQDRIFEAEVAAGEKTREVEALRDRLNASREALDAASQKLAMSDGASEGAALPNATVTVMTEALADMALEREALAAELDQAMSELSELNLTMRLDAERNDRIFHRLEEAVTGTLEPLDELFGKIGMNSETLLDTMRSRYDGQGGPLLNPISYSTKGAVDPATARANNILTHMQELDLYRQALDSLPMAMPVHAGVRRTSSFGYRRDPITGGKRLHAGVDWAGPYGTRVNSTAEGTVVFAGWQSGYGRLVKIRHEFGIETRYAHLAKINVKVGQRVSRGDKIGAMGNSGRSTGTHLHYEVRRGGKATNPMTYIQAARDVF